jgi:hypothetical protein
MLTPAFLLIFAGCIHVSSMTCEQPSLPSDSFHIVVAGHVHEDIENHYLLYSGNYCVIGAFEFLTKF